MEHTWGPSDSWLLVAIAAAGGRHRATLVEVVGVADMINHAIMNVDEIEGGIRRLEGAGLVTVEHHDVGLTGTGRDLVATSQHASGYVAQMAAMDALLAELPVGVPTTYSLPEEVYRAVIDAYIGRHRRERP